MLFALPLFSQSLLDLNRLPCAIVAAFQDGFCRTQPALHVWKPIRRGIIPKTYQWDHARSFVVILIDGASHQQIKYEIWPDASNLHSSSLLWCHVRFQPGFGNCHWFWVQRNSASIEDICGQPVKKWFVNPICQLVQHIFHRVLVRVRVEARPQADWLLLVTSKADSNRKKCKASISKVLSWPKVKKGLILYWGWLCATPKPGENGWST